MDSMASLPFGMRIRETRATQHPGPAISRHTLGVGTGGKGGDTVLTDPAGRQQARAVRQVPAGPGGTGGSGGAFGGTGGAGTTGNTGNTGDAGDAGSAGGDGTVN
jgi:hypothetical protein